MHACLEAQRLKQNETEMKRKLKETQKEEIEIKKRIAETEKVRKQQMQYNKRHDKAVQIVKNKPRPTWKVQDYKVFLLALKKKSDRPLPSKLSELSTHHDNWNDHITGGVFAIKQTQVEEKNEVAFDLQEQTTEYFLCFSQVDQKNPVGSTEAVHWIVSVPQCSKQLCTSDHFNSFISLAVVMCNTSN